LRAICAKTGLDETAFFAALDDQTIKDRLRVNTEEVIARGGFGSPTMFGNDRIPLIEAALRKT
jgi:2-hydroxychromene-2-carboxylate isomerase